MFGFWHQFRWIDALDILIVAVAIYQIILALRGTRAFQMLLGLALLYVASWVSLRIGLVTVNWALSNLLAVWLLLVIILFQPELRRALASVGRRGSLLRAFWRYQEAHMIDEVVRAGHRPGGQEGGRDHRPGAGLAPLGDRGFRDAGGRPGLAAGLSGVHLLPLFSAARRGGDPEPGPDRGRGLFSAAQHQRRICRGTSGRGTGRRSASPRKATRSPSWSRRRRGRSRWWWGRDQPPPGRGRPPAAAEPTARGRHNGASAGPGQDGRRHRQPREVRRFADRRAAGPKRSGRAGPDADAKMAVR